MILTHRDAIEITGLLTACVFTLAWCGQTVLAVLVTVAAFAVVRSAARGWDRERAGADAA